MERFRSLSFVEDMYCTFCKTSFLYGVYLLKDFVCGQPQLETGEGRFVVCENLQYGRGHWRE